MNSKITHIDINCDLGEGVGNEEALLPLISSCNIACGGHAGDKQTITAVIRLAEQNNVKVGAHPSYPDRENFGRVSMKISEGDLIASIREQVDNFTSILEKENIQLHHIKPHGALYNDIANDLILAKIFLKSIERYKDNIFIYVPFNSVIKDECLKKNFNIKYEAFADRNYNSDLTLVSRKLPNALIEDPKEVLNHLVRMVNKKRLLTVNEMSVKVVADTFCIHGDTPSALQILRSLTHELPKHNIQIEHA